MSKLLDFSGTGLELIGIQKSTRQQFSYVLVGTNLVDWNTALKVCESQGARLISLETAAKETDLIGFLASKGKLTEKLPTFSAPIVDLR